MAKDYQDQPCYSHSSSGFMSGLIFGAVLGFVIAVVIYRQDQGKLFDQLQKKLQELLSDQKSPAPPAKAKPKPRPRRPAPKKPKRFLIAKKK